MNCPVCEAENREGAHFCRMCGVKFSPDSASDVPADGEPGEPVAEGLGSEIKIEVQQERAGETPLEVDRPEAGPQGAAQATEPADEPSVKPAPKADANEISTAESEGLLEVAALQQAEGPPESQAESNSDVPSEDTAAEPALVDEAPEEQTPEPEEAQTLPDHAEDAVEMPEAAAGEEKEAADQGEPAEGGTVSPAAPGTLVADRYELIEALDVSENEILYRAEDLRGCLQCGFEENAPDDAFCGNCGAARDQRPRVRLLETQGPEGELSAGQQGASTLTHEDRTFLLLVEDAAEPEAPDVPEVLRLLVGHSTDVGQVRGLNEDSLVVMILAPTYESEARPLLGLFAVADGMGGHQGGEVASRTALQVLTSKVLQEIILPELAGQPLSPEVILELLRQATVAANDAVFLARQKRENDMGTTLTTAFVRNHDLFLAHVGDCRAYRWNADGLSQLTTDHSLVASMIASGQAEPDEIYTHPHRSVIHRCIGDQPLVEVEADVLSLSPGDRIIVCSDGLWEMVRSEGIDDVMLQEPDPQAACELLVSHANLAGGDDNISVIVIQLKA